RTTLVCLFFVPIPLSSPLQPCPPPPDLPTIVPWTGSAEIGPAFHPSAHRRQQPSQGHLRKLQPFWEATSTFQGTYNNISGFPSPGERFGEGFFSTRRLNEKKEAVSHRPRAAFYSSS
ncbi:hypothetical protein QC762_0107980, partial [Podospora pseudocomata]